MEGKIVGNFKIVKKIETIQELVDWLYHNPSIYWRFKVTSSAFFIAWQLRTIMNNLDSGQFYTIEKINNK